MLISWGKSKKCTGFLIETKLRMPFYEEIGNNSKSNVIVWANATGTKSKYQPRIAKGICDIYIREFFTIQNDNTIILYFIGLT